MSGFRSRALCAPVALAVLLALPAPASADDVAPAPRPASIAIAQREPGSAPQACAAPCTRIELDRLELVVATGPDASQAGRIATIALTHRPPGSRRAVAAGQFGVPLDATGAGSIAIRTTTIADAAGVWCMQATLPASDTAAAAQSRTTCLRYRPPVTIGWAGDTVVGSGYGMPPQGGTHMFDGVLDLLREPDLMIGNYEGTLSRGGHARCGGGALCYIFQAPPERARALAGAGFDVMNLANNHALDMGVGARMQTVRALHAAGVDASGLPGQVSVHRVQDTTVAIVGISPYPGTTPMRDFAVVRALVQRARRSADIVVVCMHVGLEGPAGAHVPHGADYGTATRAAAHAAIAAGATVVFGSGPHVVRGVERYDGRFVVYSTGNFAGWHTFGRGGLLSHSGVVTMRLDYRGVSHGSRWHGVRIVGPGLPVPDGGAVVRRVAALSRSDFGTHAARFDRDGWFH